MPNRHLILIHGIILALLAFDPIRTTRDAQQMLGQVCQILYYISYPDIFSTNAQL